MQNIYDNDLFFNAYLNLRDKKLGLNDVLEIPVFRSLLPDLSELSILDLGCGFGESSKWYITQGACRVTGVDISEKMINLAKELNSHSKITYLNCPMETMEFQENCFDLVVSSLSFHYVADFNRLINKISSYLKLGGMLVFSQEHPIITAKKCNYGWYKDKTGKKMFWIMDNYHEEGLREQTWFVEGVIKYHRSISTIINQLIDANFRIIKILEPIATEEAEKENEQLKEERRRPPFLIIKAQKS